FTAGAIRANIRGTKAEFDAAIFAYNNLLLRSTQEVLDVLAFAYKKTVIGINASYKTFPQGLKKDLVTFYISVVSVFLCSP
ncbi:hypothetical protein, partial [Legionella sp. 29fVS95]|uniref:hypothetical protein n=1 Tax=Legionella sp. 29fVS95 TaxID=3402813 RepID=UPI003AF83D82